MKRLLVGLLTLCLAAPSGARVLVCASQVSAAATGSSSQIFRAAVLGLLNRAGVEYDIASGTQMKTEFCRTGVETWNFGTSGAYTTTYTAVIHIGTSFGSNNGYRADSLFSSTKLPLIPQLIFINSYSSLSGACACSLGVSGTTAGYNTATNYMGWTQRYRESADIRYRSGFTDGLLATTAKHGTVRMLVSGGSNTAHAQTDRPTVPLPCIDCDSLLNPVADDSGVVVVEHNDHVPGKKAIVICGFAHNADDQNDPGTAMMGLAMLDSLCGGTIIKKPLQFSIQIRGGFRRNNRATRGGISPNDSTALKASIDSVASLGVRFTVGVNLDSVSTYAAEKFWWQRAPLAHFAPESWSGVNDTTTSNFTNSNYGQSIDIWGRFRRRVALGPLDNTDTSLANNIRVSLMRTDSLFPGKLDKAGMAAAYDWSPRYIGAIGLDSLWYAIWRGGLTNVIFEPQNFASNPGSARGDPLGYATYQTAMRSTLGGESIRIIGTPMAPDSGSALVEGGHSTDSFANSPQNSWCKNSESFWSGMVGVKMQNQRAPNGHVNDFYPGQYDLGENSNNQFSRCSVLTIHAGDLGSGTRADAASRPTHPGWNTIKGVVNQARICNLIANRQVVIIKYTQDLDP